MSFPHPTGPERGSYWIETTPSTDFAPVQGDERADIVVVGAGIVGITAAYLLAKQGRSVVVVDRERAAMSETGHTTAHLQTVLDTRLHILVDRFGLKGAKLAWESQLEAVRTIESIASDERIACDLTHLDAFLYSPHRSDKRMLKKEIELAAQIGYELSEASPDDVPFPAECAIRYPDQRKFHVRKYLLGVVKAAQRLGVRFFEGSEVTKVESGKRVTACTREGHRLEGDWLVSATNVPFDARVKLQTKLFAYRTYVIGAEVPRGEFGDALYWDTLDPYHYTRVERADGKDLVILGGEDHKVGSESSTEVHWGALMEYLRTATDDFEVVHKWSGEVIETQDDLPYVGAMGGRHGNELIATGDSGTGMTNGTIAAVMLAERILGRGTPWDELYDPRRVSGAGGPVLEFAKHRVDDVKGFASPFLGPSDISSVMELEPGQGGVMRVGAKRVAVYRTKEGELKAVSGTCTHLGCTVKWNSGESSWDCKCHGSRFSIEGDVLHGPAFDPLAPVALDDVVSKKEAAEWVPPDP